ncbi:MAG: hypothetical protein AAF511_06585, partial [Pseudomonadota bacterium]
FSSIGATMLVVTGTNDVVPMFAENWCDHLVSHNGAPEGLSTVMVFEGEDHYFDGLFGRPTERDVSKDDETLIQSINQFVKTGSTPMKDEYLMRLESCSANRVE